jgi:hypothetical protein
MPSRGQKIVFEAKPGQPTNRAAHLAMYAYRDNCLYASTVEQAIIQQQTTKRSAREVSGAAQRALVERKSTAARDRRDNPSAPRLGTSQLLLPID